MAFPVKRSKVAKRNETNERIKLFEHSQASSVCLSKSRLQYRFYGDISKLDNKMFFNFGYTMESHFLQIHEVKMGGHHTSFGAIMVQRYGKGEYSLQNACFQCA